MVPGMTVCIACCIVVMAILGGGTSFCSESRLPDSATQHVPPDIEMMMSDFEFRNFVDERCTIRIHASQMLRRGKKILGFRSNLIKNTIFAEISGELSSPASRVNFSGGQGEWDLKAANSLLLTDQVTLRINGKKIPVVKKAQIDFGNATIRVDEHTVLTY